MRPRVRAGGARRARGRAAAYGRTMAISKGSAVSWNTPQGRTHGTAVEKHTSSFQLDGQTFRASDDEPSWVVESHTSGARAAHKESSLRAH